jgi:hypothetical protein
MTANSVEEQCKLAGTYTLCCSMAAGKKARHNFVLAGKICCKQWDCGRTPHRELFKERGAGEFGKSSGVAIGVKTATAIS